MTDVIYSFPERSRAAGSKPDIIKSKKEEKKTNVISKICTEEHKYRIETAGY